MARVPPVLRCGPGPGQCPHAGVDRRPGRGGGRAHGDLRRGRRAVPGAAGCHRRRRRVRADAAAGARRPAAPRRPSAGRRGGARAGRRGLPDAGAGRGRGAGAGERADGTRRPGRRPGRRRRSVPAAAGRGHRRAPDGGGAAVRGGRHRRPPRGPGHRRPRRHGHGAADHRGGRHDADGDAAPGPRLPVRRGRGARAPAGRRGALRPEITYRLTGRLPAPVRVVPAPHTAAVRGAARLLEAAHTHPSAAGPVPPVAR